MDLMDFTEKNGRIIHFPQDFQPQAQTFYL